MPDFRDDAEAVSMTALQRLRIPSDDPDLSRATLSLCVRAPRDTAAMRRRMARALVLQLTLTFGFIAVGVLLVVGAHWGFPFELAGFNPPRLMPVGIGVACIAVGWLAMCTAADFANAIVRLMLRRVHAPVPPFVPSEKVVVVRMENPDNCHELKLVVEELGLLYCDAARNLIVIEGLFYRYVIRARDVRQCVLHQPTLTRHYIITFEVAGSGKVLSLAASANSARSELKRQLSHNSSTPLLLPLLARTLFPVLPLPDL